MPGDSITGGCPAHVEEDILNIYYDNETLKVGVVRWPLVYKTVGGLESLFISS